MYVCMYLCMEARLFPNLCILITRGQGKNNIVPRIVLDAIIETAGR